MSTLTVNGRDIALDKDGYLVELGDWSPEVASALAARENIELSAAHWEILELLRGFYQEFDLSPATRPLIKYTALKCSMALPPNWPPSWRACPSRRTAYDRLHAADHRNTRGTSFCAVRQIGRASPDAAAAQGRKP